MPPPLRVADIGYAVHPDARRHGVATRAVRALTHWPTLAEDGPGLAAGFAQEGVRRSFLPLRDHTAPTRVRRHDVCLHGLVART